LTTSATPDEGKYPWGTELPADVLAALENAGVVTTSGQRAYREAIHAGAGHIEAIEAAIAFSEAEAAAMGL
jgi:hypothetical protein